jgi:hypothetical protein
MSDELRLPDRLAACEAELAAQPLDVSRINRDELLYRAGWAAAEAALASRFEIASGSSEVNKALVARWSVVSAVLAASIAVAATLAISNSGADGSIASAPGEASSPIVASVAPASEVADARRQVVIDPLLERLDALARGSGATRHGVREASVWAATRRPRAGRSDQPILATVEVRSVAPAAIDGTTARELMNQLLPSGDKASVDAGEASGVLQLLKPLGWGGDTI